MKIAISGASGFVGKALAVRLREKNHTILAIGREAFGVADEQFRQTYLEGTDVVINLAGAPVAKRWTADYKKEIYDSRILTTRKIASNILQTIRKPELFISGSAIGIYDTGHIHSETSTRFSHDFLASVCQDWEKEALTVQPSVRTVIFRTGVVLGEGGGALKRMHFPFSIGLGGKIGKGNQPFSFIHLHDLLEAFLFVIENREISGFVNAVSPFPCTNAEFAEKLGKVLKQPAWLTVPPLALKALYGEGASVLLEGQHVVPEKLQQAGFRFRYPTVQNALVRIYS
jgi:uncharacterized protein (TIGR01777 family)